MLGRITFIFHCCFSWGHPTTGHQFITRQSDKIVELMICLVCMASRKYSLNREKSWAKDLSPKPSRLEFGYCHKEVVVLTPSLLPHLKKTAVALGTQSFL